jgi:hypothetical protein
VFEKNERFLPLLIANTLEPVSKIRFRIVYAAQKQIAPVRSLGKVLSGQVISV